MKKKTLKERIKVLEKKTKELQIKPHKRKFQAGDLLKVKNVLPGIVANHTKGTQLHWTTKGEYVLVTGPEQVIPAVNISAFPLYTGDTVVWSMRVIVLGTHRDLHVYLNPSVNPEHHFKLVSESQET